MATPSLTDLLKSPAVSLTDGVRGNARQSRPRHKRHHSVDHGTECTPPKQECTEPDLANNETPIAHPPVCSEPKILTNSDISNDQEVNFTQCGTVDDAQSINNTKISPTETSTHPVKKEAAPQTFSIAEASSSYLTSHTNLACKSSPEKKAYVGLGLSTSPDENKKPIAFGQCCEPQLQSVRCRPGTPMSLVHPVQSPLTPNSKVFQKENEIMYMPQQAAKKLPENWLHERNMPLSRKHSRPCNAPGVSCCLKSLLLKPLRLCFHSLLFLLCLAFSNQISIV